MQTPKERAIQMIENGMSNSLEQAQSEFKNYSPEQMQAQYGNSGQTCLDIYIKGRRVKVRGK